MIPILLFQLGGFSMVLVDSHHIRYSFTPCLVLALIRNCSVLSCELSVILVNSAHIRYSFTLS